MRVRPPLPLLLALAAPGWLTAQDPASLVEDLGDPERGEAAAAALFALGAGAVPPLAALLARGEHGDPRERERMRAALVLVSALGPDAAELGPALTALAANVQKQLRYELIRARGSLEPYAGEEDWHTLFHASFHDVRTGEKAATLAALQRHATRLQCRSPAPGSVEDLLRRLGENELFEREVWAEKLGRLGDPAAIDPLRAMLLDRDTRPAGWDAMRHNGWIVPVDDSFRLCAAEALVRLAPEDPRCAVGHGVRALAHPLLAVRREALRSIDRFGPAAADAVPELVQVATEGDPQLAAAALKTLGMAGPGVGVHLRAIDALAAGGEATVQRLAGSLAARLRAMGAEPPPLPDTAAADAEAQKLRELVAQLGRIEHEDAAEKLRAAGAAAVPALLERVRSDRQLVPRPALDLLVELAQPLAEEVRLDVRSKVMLREGETWSTKWMSSSSGGSGGHEVDGPLYARLTIGRPAAASGLLPFLEVENSYVRLEAARELGRRPAAERTEPAVRAALLAAVRGEHPHQCRFEVVSRSWRTEDVDLDARIRAAAAAALVGTGVPADQQVELLPHALRSEDAAGAAAALAAWGEGVPLPVLTAALADERPAVAVAAAGAIGARGPAAAAALADLERAAGSAAAEVAAAARDALVRVRGEGR